MNYKKIITQKELNYIETLYLYFDLQDFDDTSDYDALYRYWNVKEYLKSALLSTSKYLGEAKGRSWYQLPNYRLGLMDYDVAKAANQFNCKIQYEWQHLFSLGSSLSGLDLPLGDDRSKYHFARIDITKIAKSRIDYTRHYDYISPYRRKDFVDNTVYLGNRKNGNVFRMYDKSKELLTDTKEHPINYEKIELFSQYFGDIEDLYTFELELSRVYLRESLGIDTLLELPKVFEAYKNIVGQIRFFRDNDSNRRLVAQNHRDRVPCRVLTDYIEYERVKKKNYKPSFEYAVREMVKQADGYLERSGIEKNNDNYLKLVNAVIKERIDQNNRDLVITYEDTPLSIELEEMRAKHEAMRDNQSNELELEAWAAFGERARVSLGSNNLGGVKRPVMRLLLRAKKNGGWMSWDVVTRHQVEFPGAVAPSLFDEFI